MPRGVRQPRGGRRRLAEALVAGRGHRPEGRGAASPSTSSALRPELERLRERGVDLDVRDEDLPPQVAADAPLAGKTSSSPGAIADPRSGEKIARPAFLRLC